MCDVNEYCDVVLDFIFFFNDTATTEIYTLSLHDALPIYEARANSSTARHLASYVEEYAVANTSMQQASALTSLNGKPLIVLTADEGITDDQWQSKQDHLATLSTNSLHRHANATHASLLEDEADAAVASQAIHDVVIAVRTARPLE